MPNSVVICIAGTLPQADQIVAQLRAGTFANHHISLLFHDPAAPPSPSHPEAHAPVLPTVPAYGGALGWVERLGALVLAGDRPFVAGGPLMTALSDPLKATSDASPLAPLGIPEPEAGRYLTLVRKGGILVAVDSEDPTDLQRAEAVFQRLGASAIATFRGLAPVAPNPVSAMNLPAKDPMPKRRALKLTGPKVSKKFIPDVDRGESALQDALMDQLSDLYHAEQQLVKVLPRLAQAVRSDSLRAALEFHLVETRRQVGRLKEAATALGKTIKRRPCEAMAGLVSEAQHLLAEYAGEPALDAMLIATAQKMKHYEIAAYGTLIAWADRLGHEEVVQVLQVSLDEEKVADQKLTEIAESSVNRAAEAAHEAAK